MQGTFCSALPFAINADIRPVGSSLVWGEALTKSLLSCQGSSNLALRNQECFGLEGTSNFCFQPPAMGRELSTKLWLLWLQTKDGFSAELGSLLSPLALLLCWEWSRILVLTSLPSDRGCSEQSQESLRRISPPFAQVFFIYPERDSWEMCAAESCSQLRIISRASARTQKNVL